MVSLPVNDILYFYKDGRNMLVTTSSGEAYCLSVTIQELESQLDPDKFFRLNRQYLVNIAALKKISPFFNSKLIVQLFHCSDRNIIRKGPYSLRSGLIGKFGVKIGVGSCRGMWQLLFFVSLQCAGRKSPARQVCRKFLYLMLIVSCTVNDAWCLDFSVSLHPCFFILPLCDIFASYSNIEMEKRQEMCNFKNLMK